jgi:hydrogenase maturation protease
MGLIGVRTRKIAIVGVGNILLKDEGIGVRVVQQLQSTYSFPDAIALIDGGTAGPHLLDLFSSYDDIIIIDAVKGGEKPGTVYKFSLDQISTDTTLNLSIHQMGVLEIFSQARLLGKEPRVTFIGIEPLDITTWGMELTPLIREKIPELIELVLKELYQLGVSRSALSRKLDMNRSLHSSA